MKITVTTIISALAIIGCAEQPNYQLTVASQQLKEVQVLDPMAPERNDGITATLDGNYGKNVINDYLSSSYDKKAGRDVTERGSGSGSGKGK